MFVFIFCNLLAKETGGKVSHDQALNINKSTNISMKTNTSETTFSEKPEEGKFENIVVPELIKTRCEALFDPKESSSFYFHGPSFENASRSYKHVRN